MERSIALLSIEYERFFTGDLKLPPVQTVRKVEASIRRLSNVELDGAAERFRFQGIQNRFQAVKELWEKRLLARETGRGSFGHRPAAAAARVPAVAPKPAPGDASGPDSVQGKKRVSFAPLFERYLDARRALGEDVSRLKYEKFEEQVRRQAEEIRGKTGMTRLVFEIVTAEGKVRLVGRPMPAKGNG